MVVSIAAILDACSIYLMTFSQKESPITNDVHVLLYPLVLTFISDVLLKCQRLT